MDNLENSLMLNESLSKLTTLANNPNKYNLNKTQIIAEMNKFLSPENNPKNPYNTTNNSNNNNNIQLDNNTNLDSNNLKNPNIITNSPNNLSINYTSHPYSTNSNGNNGNNVNNSVNGNKNNDFQGLKNNQVNQNNYLSERSTSGNKILNNNNQKEEEKSSIITSTSLSHKRITNTLKSQNYPTSPLFALNLSKKNLTTLSKSLADCCKTLCILEISYSQLVEFPQEILSCKMLKIIKMDHNFLKKLPNEIANLIHLESLSLSNNCLLSLPKTIGQLKQLILLNLSRNHIDELLKELCDLTNLKMLYINNNYFIAIPNQLNQLTNLTEISLEWFKYANPSCNPIQNDKNRKGILKLFELCKLYQDLNKSEINFEEFINYFSTPGKINLLYIKDSHCRNLLHITVLEEEIGIIKYLLQNKESLINQLDQDHQTPLSLAIREEKYMVARILLCHGVDAKIGGGTCGSALHMAVTRFQHDIVKDLLKNGANPNTQDQDGNTPLHLLLTIFSKDLEKAGELAQLLLDYGANPNIKNEDRWAPVHLAVRRGHSEGIKWIIQHNYKVRADDPKYFDINLKGGAEKWTPLHLASSLGQIEILTYLFEYEVDMTERTRNGKTARDVCISNLIMSKLLKKYETLWINKQLFKENSLDNKLKEISLNASDVSRLKNMINMSSLKTFKMITGATNRSKPYNNTGITNNLGNRGKYDDSKRAKGISTSFPNDRLQQLGFPRSKNIANKIDNTDNSVVVDCIKNNIENESKEQDESLMIGDIDEINGDDRFEKETRIIPRSPNNIQKIQIAQNYRNYIINQINSPNISTFDPNGGYANSLNGYNPTISIERQSNTQNFRSSSVCEKNITPLRSCESGLQSSSSAAYQLSLGLAFNNKQKLLSPLPKNQLFTQLNLINPANNAKIFDSTDFHGYIKNFEGYIDEIKKFQILVMNRDQVLSERLKYLFYLKLFHMKINELFHKLHSEMLPLEIFIINEYIEDELRKERNSTKTRINNNNDIVPRTLLFIFESLDSSSSHASSLLKSEIAYIFGQFKFTSGKHFLDQVINNPKEKTMVKYEAALSKLLVENLSIDALLSPKRLLSPAGTTANCNSSRHSAYSSHPHYGGVGIGVVNTAKMANTMNTVTGTASNTAKKEILLKTEGGPITMNGVKIVANKANGKNNVDSNESMLSLSNRNSRNNMNNYNNMSSIKRNGNNNKGDISLEMPNKIKTNIGPHRNKTNPNYQNPLTTRAIITSNYTELKSSAKKNINSNEYDLMTNRMLINHESTTTKEENIIDEDDVLTKRNTIKNIGLLGDQKKMVNDYVLDEFDNQITNKNQFTKYDNRHKGPSKRHNKAIILNDNNELGQKYMDKSHSKSILDESIVKTNFDTKNMQMKIVAGDYFAS